MNHCPKCGESLAFTAAEVAVMKLIAQGMQNKAAADALCRSVKTVEKHRTNVLAKLSARGSWAITIYCLQKGLVNLSDLVVEIKGHGHE